MKLNNKIRLSEIRTIIHYLYTSVKSSIGVIAAFTIFPLLILSGCDTSGSVGGGVHPDDETINNIEIGLDELSLLQAETFSGNLANTSVGSVSDPVYGNTTSIALFKPSISSSDVDTLVEADTLFLQLIFDPAVYGDEMSTSTFDVYEAGEIWRGSQFRYNQSVDINYSNKIATFQLAGADTTALVELNNSWKNKFAEYFNSSEADRDSLYRQQFPGLAIVPAEGTSHIRFLKNQQIDDEKITAIIVRSPEEEEDPEDEGEGDSDNNDDEDEEEEEEDSEPTIYFRDWAASVTKTAPPASETRMIVSNTSHVLRINPDFSLPNVDLSSKNIVNAQLLLYKDREPEDMTPEISRPVSTWLRAHLFSETPQDIMAEIFTTSPRYQAVIEEDEDVFKMDITEFVLNQVFGEENTNELYVTLQSVNGMFYTNHFFSLDDPEKQPKIIITTVE